MSDLVRVLGTSPPSTLASGNSVAPTPLQRETLHGPPKPSDVLHAVRRRWWLILIMGVLASAGVMVFAWRTIPVEYTATAWLQVSLERPRVLFDTKDDDPLLRNRQTQTTLVTSNRVLTAALQRPGISQLPYIRNQVDPIMWLRRNLRVRFADQAEILEISMTGGDPEQIAAIVNAVKDAYMSEVGDVSRNYALERKKLLEANYAQTLELVKKRDQRYRELANAVGSADSEVARKKALTALETLADHRKHVNELRQQISGLERRIAILQSRLRYMEEHRPQTSEEERRQRDEAVIQQIVENALRADPWIAAAQARLSYLETRWFEERQRAAQGEKAPSAQRIQEEMETLRKGLEQRRAELTPQLVEFAREQLAKGRAVAPPTETEQIQAEIAQAELEKAVLEDELKVALEQFEKEAAEAEQLGKYSADLEAERAEVERLKAIAARMGDELERWNIELAAPPRVRVLEEASTPRISNINDKYRLVSFLGLMAFLGTGAAVVLLDFFLRPVSSAYQISYGLGLPVLGDLPLIERPIMRWMSRNGHMPETMRSVLIESVDQLRTILLHRAERQGLKVVLVTSALAREGKTTLVAQLATSLARAGRRVVVVDGDLRRPRLHRLFRCPLSPGLSELAKNLARPEEIVRNAEIENLYVVTAGHCDGEVLEAVSQGKLDRFLQSLRDQCDLVLVDSSPILTTADALILAHVADSVVLSVIQDKSRLPRVFEAVQRLRSVDLPLLGIVLHGTAPSRYRSYYRSYTIDVESRAAE
ncbi:Tyrosine-protein kinase EpsD [Thermogutta terrifontis]|uniref:non-specific protein-tyrosine kinase n=1 Tax=Thermogutta terrifontis TaxID=1331910 RepID=A0A286RD13_9BACT|nr:polysaccharide biosynthesis tyrosine autokinase [Thermogutta terrifontis]ASV73841.1 Tyrosine-protein kinase EpsD [Thermogutta terrifontis]